MTWATITLQTTTPLFNRGFDDADGTALRVRSIKGSVAFWLRALLGAAVGDDIAALHRWEARVFGQAAGGDSTTTHGEGVLQWRISDQPTFVPPEQKPTWLPSHGKSSPHGQELPTTQGEETQGEDRWLVYLAGPGLADAGTCTLARPHVPPEETISLRLRARRDDPEATALALTALWLTCVFGGVGARVRRGFGGLRIRFVDWGDFAVPTMWSEGELTKLPDYRTLDRLWHPILDTALQPVLRSTGGYYRWDNAPPYPVLSPPHNGRYQTTKAGLGVAPYLTWDEALAKAGEQWRLMRATEDLDTGLPEGAWLPYEPYVRTPEWAVAVLGTSPDFPLGALGLPVQFKKDISVNAYKGGEQARRASPMWIRVVRLRDSWHIFNAVFRDRFLPAGTTVELDKAHRRHTRTVPPSALDTYTDAWLAALRGYL